MDGSSISATLSNHCSLCALDIGSFPCAAFHLQHAILYPILDLQRGSGSAAQRLRHVSASVAQRLRHISGSAAQRLRPFVCSVLSVRRNMALRGPQLLGDTLSGMLHLPEKPAGCQMTGSGKWGPRRRVQRTTSYSLQLPLCRRVAQESHTSRQARGLLYTERTPRRIALRHFACASAEAEDTVMGTAVTQAFMCHAFREGAHHYPELMLYLYLCRAQLCLETTNSKLCHAFCDTYAFPRTAW